MTSSRPSSLQALLVNTSTASWICSSLIILSTRTDCSELSSVLAGSSSRLRTSGWPREMRESSLRSLSVSWELRLITGQASIPSS